MGSNIDEKNKYGIDRDAKKIKLGKTYIIIGNIPENTTIDDIYSIVLINNEAISEYIGEYIYTVPEDEQIRETEKKPISKEPKEREETYVGGVSGGIIGDNGTKENISDEKKDDNKKNKTVVLPPWVGKATKIGTSILAATLLLSAIATTKVVTTDRIVTPSDYTATDEVSDIIVADFGDGKVSIPSSVIPNPGILIKHQRAEYIAENNGTREGVNEYLENSTDESRIAEEEKIEEITKSFDEQQKIIHEAQKVLEDSNATDSQKYEAIQTIKSAKAEEISIYMTNYDLYKQYSQKSVDAFNKDGGDERSEFETDVSRLENSEYMIAISNLERDESSLRSILGVLDNPEMLFEETSPAEGTTVKDYVIETEIFGKPIKFLEKSDKFYISVDYDTDLQLQEGHQVGSGITSITADKITKTETTFKGISGIVESLKRLTSGKDINEVSIFGKTIYENDKEDSGRED